MKAPAALGIRIALERNSVLSLVLPSPVLPVLGRVLILSRYCPYESINSSPVDFLRGQSPTNALKSPVPENLSVKSLIGGQLGVFC